MTVRETDRNPTQDARGGILEAARREIIRAGWAAATSGHVAQLAGVSKALIHYHFHDKHMLLTAVAAKCGEDIAERGAEEVVYSADENPVDEFGDWLEREIVAGDVQIAIQLRTAPDRLVKHAADEALMAFRRELERRIDAVFTALELTPRIPPELVVDLFARMIEGMAAVQMSSSAHRRRIAETLWLSMLSIAE